MINIFDKNQVSENWFLTIYVVSCVTSVLYFLVDKSIEGFGYYISGAVFLCFFISMLTAKWFNIKLANSLFWFSISHSIIFPLIYVSLLSRDPKCFVFDRDISSNRTHAAFKEIEEKYAITYNVESCKATSNIIKENSKKLDSILIGNFLGKYTFLFTTHFVFKIYAVPTEKTRGMHPLPTHYTTVYDKSSKRIILYLNSRGRKTLRELILKENNTSLAEIKAYRQHDKRIKNGEIWTYSSLLPYCLNIFWNGNMVPSSPLANWVNFIHNILVFVFALSSISQTIDKREINEDNTKNYR
jgi:hypothetical protein